MAKSVKNKKPKVEVKKIEPVKSNKPKQGAQNKYQKYPQLTTEVELEKEYWTEFEYMCPVRGLVKEKVKVKKMKSKNFDNFQTITSTNKSNILVDIETTEEIMIIDAIEPDTTNPDSSFY